MPDDPRPDHERLRRRDGSVPPERSWLTVPNLVTLLRLALTAPIVVLVVQGRAPALTLTLLLLFGATDWVDGHLARRLGQVSRVGTVLDPIADRLGVAAVVTAFIVAGHLSVWIAVVVVVVDVVVAVGILTCPSASPTVSPLGKVRTATLMTALALLALGLLPGLDGVADLGRVVAAVGAALHAAAGVGYVRAVVGSRSASIRPTARARVLRS